MDIKQIENKEQLVKYLLNNKEERIQRHRIISSDFNNLTVNCLMCGENAKAIIIKRKEKNILQCHNAKLEQYKNKHLRFTQKEKDIFIKNNKCSICDNNFKSKRDCNIDYDHKNKKIKGLLCERCKRKMCTIKEDTAILIKLINYNTQK